MVKMSVAYSQLLCEREIHLQLETMTTRTYLIKGFIQIQWFSPLKHPFHVCICRRSLSQTCFLWNPSATVPTRDPNKPPPPLSST